MKLSFAFSISVLCMPMFVAQLNPSDTRTDTRPNVPIDFVGFLPGTQDRSFTGTVAGEFGIYLTPTGGTPVWTEQHTLSVVNGQVAVQLGRSVPIPWSIT